MVTLDQIQQHKYVPNKGKYLGPTYYMGQEIPVWSHPSTIALGMLNRLYHRRFQGMMIIGTMGDGKTVLATTLAHQIHEHASKGIKVPIRKEDGTIEDQVIKWDFKVVWAGPHEFTHQEEFYKSLPKFPTLIIYDDISGALKQIGEKQMEANFSTLSEIRWKLDPQTGMIPAMVIVLYHYSKNLEKEFRSVLGMDTIFTEISNEERTNMDSIAPKGSMAHSMMENFDRIAKPMIEDHKFFLHLGNGKKLEYLTDQPFRCACAITKDDGKLILFSNKDNCDLCVKRKRKYQTSVDQIYNMMTSLGYGSYAIKAMEFALEERGHPIIHPYFTYSKTFFENKIASRFDFDWMDLRNYILSQQHKTRQIAKKNRKKTKEAESIDELQKNSTFIEETMPQPEKPEKPEPLPSEFNLDF